MGLLADSFRAIASLGRETKAIAAMAVPTWQQGTPQVPVLSRYSYDQLARKGYMGSEVVFAAIQAVGKSAALPYMVVYESQEKDADPIYTHPALDVLNRPNKYWTRFQLLNSTVTMLKLAGNAYWERVRDQRGKVVEYWPLRPDRMWVIPDEKNYIAGYEYKLGDITYHLKPEDVIHFRNPHPLNDYYGLAPLAVLIERIDIDVWCREFTAAFFKNAGVPSGLLNIQRSVEPNEREILRQRWKQQYGGPDGWGNLLVIDNGQASYTQMGMGPGASGIALTEINQVSESRICMTLDVPPSIIWTVLGHHASSGLNNSNKESDRAQWWQGALVPMYEDIAQQFTLASIDDWSGVDHFAFDLTQVPGGSEDQDKVHARVRSDWQAGLVPWHIAAGMLGYPTEEPGWVILPAAVIPTPSEQLAKYTPGQTPPGQPEQPAGGASQGQEQGSGDGGGSGNNEEGSAGGSSGGGQGGSSSGGGSSGGGGRGGGGSSGGGGAGSSGGGGAASGGGGAAGAGAGGEGTKLVAMTISKMTADGQFEIIPGCKVDGMGNHYRSVQLGMCAWCREDPFLLKRANAYDYSSTQLNLPDILGKELVQWAREHIDPDDLGAEGIETQPHVTVKFGLMPSVKPTDVARVVKDQSPVSLSFGNNYVFAGGADPQGGVPLYVSVNSEDLGHLNGVIKRALPNVETYSQYQPHVTVAYIKADAVNKYVGQRSPLYGMHVTLDDLQFSGSDGKQVKIPLGIGENKALTEGLDGSGGYMVPADSARRRSNGHTNGKRKSSDLYELLDYFRDKFADGFTDFQKAVDALQPEPIEVAAWLFNHSTGTWPTKIQNGEMLSYKAGNIEALLDYWKDRFDGGKPGDFDECVSTLTDKVDDPDALCAWLHHEATGYWPGSAPAEKGDKTYLNGWEVVIVDKRSELERKLTEQVRQMERALLQSGVAVTPYRPRTQTWLSILDDDKVFNPDQPRDDHGRFTAMAGGEGEVQSGNSSHLITSANPTGWLQGRADSQRLYKQGPPGSDGKPTYTQGRLDTVHDPAVDRAMHGVYEDNEGGVPGGGLVPEANGDLTVEVMGGGGASGKSSILKGGQVEGVPDKNHAVWSNADWVKTEDIPEYAAMHDAGSQQGAMKVHEESSDIAARVVKTALESNRNVVVDAVMNSNFNKLAAKIQGYRDSGAKVVNANYLTVPIPQALGAAEARAATTGRHIDPAIIRDAHTSVNSMLPKILNSDIYDTMKIWDNSAGADGKWVPKLVAERTADDRVIIHDQALYDNMVKRGDPSYTH